MKIVLLLVVVLGGALVLRNRTPRGQQSQKSERLMTANEAPPTETGKLRVAQIVKAIRTDPSAGTAAAASGSSAPNGPIHGEGAEHLPDPFASGKETPDK